VKKTDFHLNESEGMYEMKVSIPEKEKDNIKVIVHENKVIVQGQRRFEDKIEQPDNKLSTSSFQSYRQEIPLEHPVLEKYAVHDWKDGILTLKIPKA